MADPDLTTELQDSDERPGFDWARFEWARLLNQNALRRMGGIVVALMVVFWPDRSDMVLARLIGAGMLVYGAPLMLSLLRERPFPWLTWVGLSAAMVLGGFLVVAPVTTEVALGRILGLGIAVSGLRKLLPAQTGETGSIGWQITSALALIAVGGFVAAFPSELFATLTVTAAIGWIVAEVISISIIIDPDRDPDAPRTDTLVLIEEWFAERPKTVDDRQRLYRELLYEGPHTQTRVVRFVMLMIFAAVIAAMGVVADSTAVVVGAMLIAPLMTPLMAMALSLAMGWPHRLARSALVAVGGIAIAITIGFIVGLADFTIVDTLTNTQITSRSNPTTVDLITAIAAGAAGAYGLSRPDVSNSLPGVAIAIALVPPLSVAGISFSQSDWDSGNGALLLFLTNAVAILVVGGVMFLLLGVAPLAQATANQHRVRTALAAIVGAAALIIGALMLNGTNLASNVFEQRAVQRVVADWIEPFPDHTTLDISLSGDTVSIVLAGPAADEVPRAGPLADQLSEELGRGVSVDLAIRLEARERSD